MLQRDDKEVHYRLNPAHPSMESLIDTYLSLDSSGLRVDLGCGYYKPAGFIGVDSLIGASTQIQNDENSPDIFMDLDTGRVPLPDRSCVEIRTSHFLEHSNLPHVFDEVYRLLKSGGIFTNIVPYANYAEGMYPGHHIFLTEKWFQ